MMCGQKTLVLTLALVSVMLMCPGDCQASCCCPTFWTAYNSSCYRLFSYSMNWHEAEAHCNQFSRPSLGDGDRDSFAHLVSIHSPDEHDFVVSYFRSTGIKDQGDDESTGRDMWVGFHDIASEGNFEWTDRSSFNMNVWSPGQPDNSGSREHCGEIRGVYGYRWNDEPCDRVAQYFMCKLPVW
ncbi:echinoidin-like [Lytechinus variegatus]|uniref:echinoidin-like n=1 Tax=Lytechinus variegatus TaxID=7654 RepID=UPI001BB2937F|nr:echinoidin-like [Lytechinus variegatus]